MTTSRQSGLQVNYAKSSATLIRGETDEETNAVELLGCPIVELPISYLGIPLTIHKPTAAQLQPSWREWLANFLPGKQDSCSSQDDLHSSKQS
jgi:hypothetical protein